MKSKIEQGQDLNKLLEDPYLSIHFEPYEIEYLYNLTVERIKREAFVQKNMKRHLIAVRLDEECYQLVKENTSERIRNAIMKTYKRGSV